MLRKRVRESKLDCAVTTCDPLWMAYSNHQTEKKNEMDEIIKLDLLRVLVNPFSLTSFVVIPNVVQ
jgi:hypothetical protein